MQREKMFRIKNKRNKKIKYKTESKRYRVKTI